MLYLMHGHQHIEYLKNYGIFELFKNVFISSDLGFKKSDKTLFEIALEKIPPTMKISLLMIDMIYLKFPKVMALFQ